MTGKLLLLVAVLASFTAGALARNVLGDAWANLTARVQVFRFKRGQRRAARRLAALEKRGARRIA